MLNLREAIMQIIQNNPEMAVPVYDVLLFMKRPDAAKTADFDEAVELLYAMTPDSRRHREIYEKARAA